MYLRDFVYLFSLKKSLFTAHVYIRKWTLNLSLLQKIKERNGATQTTHASSNPVALNFCRVLNPFENIERVKNCSPKMHIQYRQHFMDNFRGFSGSLKAIFFFLWWVIYCKIIYKYLAIFSNLNNGPTISSDKDSSMLKTKSAGWIFFASCLRMKLDFH